MKKAISKTVVVAAGLLAATRPANPVIRVDQAVQPEDPRSEKIRYFFAGMNCPAQSLAADFVQAADQNDLDWRFLPSISFIESTGGKAYKNNNILGWDNAETRFRSINEGIYLVASRLRRSKIYKNRCLTDKLRLYNSSPEYHAKVRGTMQRLGPRVLLPAN
jgi:hypothetical protein